MALQYLKDNYNNTTAVVVPISDWEKITQAHQDINLLVESDKKTPKKTMKDFRGCLSDETAKLMQEAVVNSKNEWDERLHK